MAIGMLFLAAVCWGLSIPVMKALGVEQALLVPGAGTWVASAASLAVRFGAAAVFLFAAIRPPPGRPGRITPLEWRNGLVLGAVTAISMLLQVDGLNYTKASTSGFLIAMYSVLIPLYSCLAGLRRPSWMLAACCLLTMAGMACLTGIDPRAFALGRGEWESLGAAALFAMQILWLGRLKTGSFHPGRLTFVLCASVSLFSLFMLMAMPRGAALLAGAHASWRAGALTLLLALGGTAAPFLLMNHFQTRVAAVAAGFIYCFEPIASALGALFLPGWLVRTPSLYPNETWNLRLWLGGGLIIAANLLLLRDHGESAEKAGLPVPAPPQSP